MSDLYHELQKQRKRLQSYLLHIEKFLESAPEGHIIVENRNHGARYYVQKSGSRTKGDGFMYISSKEKELIGKYVKKSYYQKLKPEIEKELALIDRFSSAFFNGKKEKIYRDLSNLKKTYVAPVFMPPEYRMNAFEKEKPESKSMKGNERYQITVRGEHVRSKSEKIIADELSRRNIPYKYEHPLVLGGYEKSIYPDFTLLNRRTGKIIYWEHLGLADNVSYTESAMWRLELYMRNGIMPGDGLIITVESARYGLNMKAVSWYIDEFLV